MPGRQFRADLGQRQGRPVGNQGQHRVAVLAQAGAVVAAHRPGARRALGAPPLCPADRRALAHPEPLRRRARRTARRHRRCQTLPQVLRVWCRHGSCPSMLVIPAESQTFNLLGTPKNHSPSQPDRKPLESISPTLHELSVEFRRDQQTLSDRFKLFHGIPVFFIGHRNATPDHIFTTTFNEDPSYKVV
jgi:hypothetical protein